MVLVLVLVPAAPSASLRFLWGDSEDEDAATSCCCFSFFFCRLRSACERTVSSVTGRGCGASSSALLASEAELSDDSTSTCFLFLAGGGELLDSGSEDDPDDEEGMIGKNLRAIALERVDQHVTRTRRYD